MVKWLRRLRSKHMKMCLIHSKGLDILTNPYDLVVEYNRKTKEITNRIEFPWFNYGWDIPDWYAPTSIQYDEHKNQFTPYLVIRKKWDIEGIKPNEQGKYEGDFDSIKIGDVITDEMVQASYRLPINTTTRMDEYIKLQKKVDFYQLLDGRMPPMKPFLANAWVFGDIDEMQVRNAVGKSFLYNQEEAEEILAIPKLDKPL